MTDTPALEGGESIRSRENYLIFGQPVIGKQEIDAVTECLASRWIGTGPRVARFEEAFGNYTGAKNVAAVASCTAGLHLAMLALDVGHGDEVITTPMTFCATVNAILHTGARPVLVDCDAKTQNIDPAAIEAAITDRTRAILLVHFAGRSCDMDAIMELARTHDIRVIEDCAHAIETLWHGRHAGTFGDIGCFSFYATKNITTGEGGMVIGRDESLVERVKILGLHGLSNDAWKRFSDEGYRHYQVVEPGFKYNMTDIQAAIGLKQLERIDTFAERRREIWAKFQSAFSDLPCDLPLPVEDHSLHGRHLYTPLLRLDKLKVSRDHILKALDAEGIGCGVHYVAVHLHKGYKDIFPGQQFSAAEAISQRTISLPLSAGMTDQDADDVITAFRRTLAFYGR